MTAEKKYQIALRKRAEEMLSIKKNLLSEYPISSLEQTQKIIHELEVHQIELELQNEELIAVQGKLELSKDKYFNLYDMAPIGYCTLTKDGLIEDVNFEVLDLFGKEREFVIKKPLTHFIFSEDQDIYYLFRKKFFASQQQEECELRIIGSDKIPLWVHLTAIQEINKVRLIIKDISKRKKYEEKVDEEVEKNRQKTQQLIKQSHLAQMGGMISMIAHQWRQPLSTISMGANNILLDIDLDNVNNDNLRNSVNTILEMTQELSKIIDDFRNFHKQNKESVVTKLEYVIEKSLLIVKPSLVNNNIKIIVEYNSDKEMELYDNEMMHVILNIVTNAKDAIKEKEIKDPYIKITTKNKKISICDNAGGIAENIIDKIFDPYFSTKDERNGTGLGLYMSKTIVEEHHHGKLRAKNTDDGVCFTIELGKILKNKKR